MKTEIEIARERDVLAELSKRKPKDKKLRIEIELLNWVLDIEKP
jgi:hypothetical protein